MDSAGTSNNLHNEEEGSEHCKNRPADSKFKQQKLPAWQPILTADTVLPTFFIIGIVFIALGSGLLVTSNKVQETSIDYTDCFSIDKQTGEEKVKCSTLVPATRCTCSVGFPLTEDYNGQVYIYYGLSNFYQNHRRYVKSRSDTQLLGNPTSGSSDCVPFNSENGTGPVYAPCGAIANSMFNDSFVITNDNDNSPIPVQATGIAWPTDKARKFKNPPLPDSCSNSSNEACWAMAFNHTAKPMDWSKPVYMLDLSDPSNNGFENEALIVWMRTAALPTFRKLYQKLVRGGGDDQYKNGLPKGNYTLTVKYNYPVTGFYGQKRMILSTASWMGAKNSFLGVAYIVIGSLCVLLGLVFLGIHWKFGKDLTEMANVQRRV